MSPARPTTKAPAPPTEQAADAEVTSVTDDDIAPFLTEEERAQLVGHLDAVEARDALPAAPTDLVSRVTRRLMRDRDHLESCPGTDAPDDVRVEAYAQQIPVTNTTGKLGPPGGTCTVVRCLECAGMRLMRDTPNDNIRALVQSAPDAAALGG